MQKEEIIGGLKTAIERGYNLEQAKRSFVNAGYNAKDVEDSAGFFSAGGVLPVSIPANSMQNSQNSNSREQLNFSQNTASFGAKPKGKGNFVIILLVIVLVLLFGFLLLSIFAKQFILGLFGA